MTAVVGILNKRGAAIAADSAVTRKRSQNGMQKITNNGNKMIRLYDSLPISVMMTGNADFLGTPWDVIARRYRQRHKDVRPYTVEDAARGFFDYIRSNFVFWSEERSNTFLWRLTEKMFNEVVARIHYDEKERRGAELRRPAAFRKAFIRISKKMAAHNLKGEQCPQFVDYSAEAFRVDAKDVLDRFIKEMDSANRNGFSESCYPSTILESVRPAFEDLLHSVISTRYYIENVSATLVFTGFGEKQEYPSLVSANVTEGFAGRMSYSIRKEDVVCISDQRPVAICPFAQTDVIVSLLQGMHSGWRAKADSRLSNLTKPVIGPVFSDISDWDFFEKLKEVKKDDLYKEFDRNIMRLSRASQRGWEKSLEKSDLQAMASLADSLIDLTAFHRILTFEEEGVGGLVDLAVISKDEGFTWLRRKSWYHNKDVGGKYGKLGV